MNRAQLQLIAHNRILDARALIAAGRWGAAYYLIGYAVECGLKSCLLRHLEATGVIFSDRDYLRKLADCWTHDLAKLVNLAGLDADFGVARGANLTLEANWSITKDWEETSRYEEKTEAEAKALFDAVTSDPDGVLLWIQSRW